MSEYNYKKYSQRQDKRVAKLTNQEIVRNSGAVRGRRGDLRKQNLLSETKTTIRSQKTFTLRREWFDKIDQQAFQMGKEFGIIIFSFGDNKDFVACSLEDFDQIYESKCQLERKIVKP